MTIEIILNNSEILKEAQRLSKLDYSPNFVQCLKVAIKKLTKIEQNKQKEEFETVRKEYDQIILSIFQSAIKLENCYHDSYKRTIYQKWLDADFNILFSFASDKEKFEKFCLGDTGSVYCFGYDEFHKDKESVKGYLISRARFYDRY